jgi:molybdopterin synthase sulfur carrier subunit
MIQLLYFASLREDLGVGSEQIELPDDVQDLAALSAFLGERGGDWSRAFNSGRPLMMAVNQSAASADSAVRDGDEVAFFPPVTGG